MVNHFRSEMPMPLMGIGHSFGGCALVDLALMHPRLLSTLILLDPVIHDTEGPSVGGTPATQSTFRRDLWPSRAVAEAAFRKQKFYQSWDPRVFDRWCKFGIRETPTTLYPNEHGAMTLTTTKHQECFTFLRPSWPGISEDGSKIVSREKVPDVNIVGAPKYPFYRPEPPKTQRRLGEVRPSVLYIFGGESDMSVPELRQSKVNTTGAGVGGSGGAKEGRVKDVILNGIGHLVAMEASNQCAAAAAPWLAQEVQRFRMERNAYLEWTSKALVEKSTLSQEWRKRMGGDPRLRKGKI
jgi:pimeloyl-ACP methyl ester carboxylesterase